MPRWHEATQEWVRTGRLHVVGVAQEQYPERCALFAQWRGIDWPIAHDPLNLLGVRGVPIAVAIDEYGIVRAMNLTPETIETEFLEQTYEPPETPPPALAGTPPDIGAATRFAEENPSADAWRALGDAVVLFGADADPGAAIRAYDRARVLDPTRASTLFRLGVVHQMRADSPAGKPGDLAAAARFLGEALAADPGNYIVRRRIEQYSPAKRKPYPFYGWIDTAENEIRERGETPCPVTVRPSGAEIATPGNAAPDALLPTDCPDPDGQIPADDRDLVAADTAAFPDRAEPGTPVAVQVTLRPNRAKGVTWEDAAGEPVLWVDAPPGWSIAPIAAEPVAAEPHGSAALRKLALDVRSPADVAGDTVLAGFVLYGVCETEAGTCTYLRRDLRFTIRGPGPK